jgi:peptide/nickel transport system ATP-binding protein
LSAVPSVDPATRREIVGCRATCHHRPILLGRHFTALPQAMPECRQTYPETSDLSTTHTTRCHLYR